MCCQKNCWKCSAHLSHVSLLGEGVAQCEGISRERKSGDLVLVLALLLAGQVGDIFFNMESQSKRVKLVDREEGKEGEREIDSSSHSQQSGVNADEMGLLGM